MKVKELIKELQKYNLEAEFEIILDGQIPMSNYSLYYSGKNDVTPLTCKMVTIDIDTSELEHN
jgi:hypothetical protein